MILVFRAFRNMMSIWDWCFICWFWCSMFDTCAISFARREYLMCGSSRWMLMLDYDLHLIWIPFLLLTCASLCCFCCCFFLSQILTTCWSLINAYRSTNLKFRTKTKTSFILCYGWVSVKEVQKTSNGPEYPIQLICISFMSCWARISIEIRMKCRHRP